jgi:hypothetical protein
MSPSYAIHTIFNYMRQQSVLHTLLPSSLLQTKQFVMFSEAMLNACKTTAGNERAETSPTARCSQQFHTRNGMDSLEIWALGLLLQSSMRSFPKTFKFNCGIRQQNGHTNPLNKTRTLYKGVVKNFTERFWHISAVRLSNCGTQSMWDFWGNKVPTSETDSFQSTYVLYRPSWNHDRLWHLWARSDDMALLSCVRNSPGSVFVSWLMPATQIQTHCCYVSR